MKSDPKQINALLCNFATILVDGHFDAVSVTTENAGTFFTDEERSECVPPLEEETVIVRLETEEDGNGTIDDFYFREDDILNAEIADDREALKVKDTDGNDRTLQFNQTKVVRLISAVMWRQLLTEAQVKEALSPSMRKVWEAAMTCVDFPSNIAFEEFSKVCRPAEILVLLRAFAESYPPVTTPDPPTTKTSIDT